MTTNYDIDNLFYHIEFEGRECVFVQAFVMSLEDSSSGQCFCILFFCLKLEIFEVYCRVVTNLLGDVQTGRKWQSGLNWV